MDDAPETALFLMVAGSFIGLAALDGAPEGHQLAPWLARLVWPVWVWRMAGAHHFAEMVVARFVPTWARKIIGI